MMCAARKQGPILHMRLEDHHPESIDSAGMVLLLGAFAMRMHRG